VLTNYRIKMLAMSLLFPGVLLNVTVANQMWDLGPVYAGQLVFWPAIACAALVVTLSFGSRSLWPPFIIGWLVAARAVGANQAQGLVQLFYAIPLASLFVLAGGITAAAMPRRIWSQLRFYFLLSVPLMLLQVAGAGSWALALNTETEAVGDLGASAARTVYPTLLVPYDQVRFAIGQARPAGVMHANNMLSFVIMLALAVQFGRIQSRRVTWTDALFCAALVLCMAKIVMLGFICLVVWFSVTGSCVQRARIRRVVLLTACLYAAYGLLFPGLFQHHFRLEHMSYSVLIRVNDFIATFDPSGPAIQGVLARLQDTPTLSDPDDPGRGGMLSGYAMIVRLLPALAVVAMLASVPFCNSLRAVRLQSRAVGSTAIGVLLMVILFPVAVPAFGSPLYAFALGMGLMPMIWYYSPGLRRRYPLSSLSMKARDV
jgi:hypothetical protein